MSTFARFASAAAVAALLSACGAKGPLFMPEKPAPEQQEVPEEMMPTDPAEVPPADDGAASAQVPVETPVDTTEPSADDDGNP